MIVANQNMYNSLQFDPLPLIYVEFRRARFMIWFRVVRFTLF